MKRIMGTRNASPRRRVAMAGALTILLGFIAGCGATRMVASANIPVPLVVKVPVTVALYVPKEFAEFVHQEKRWSTDWNMELGKAQAEGMTRLVGAMFERVVMVDSIEAGAQLGEEVRAILEPSVEEYAFVTPRDAGSPFYAVSVKYRMNVYSPDGRLADSWGFTGYGTSQAEGLSSVTPLARATALAMRDAGAKLAVEFREQAIVHGLLPEAEAPETPASEPAPPAEDPSVGPAAPESQPPIPKPEPKPAPQLEPKPDPQPQDEGEEQAQA